MKKSTGIPQNKNSLFNRVILDNCYCWIAAIITMIITVIIAICFRMVPFGDMTILRMDMYHQYCPLFAELYDRVTGMQSLLYSWRSGMGSAFVGNFFNYLCSPSAIFVLIFGHENVPEAIAAMIFSKACFASFSFTYYLKKAYNRSDFATAAFGILYCMCGWFIAYYWDVMWVDAMVFFPIVILGIDRIIRECRPLTYIIALAAVLITNYYMGYMVCIFSVIYFFACFFTNWNINSLDGRQSYWIYADGKKKNSVFSSIAHSRIVRSGVTFAVGSLAAGALAAFALVPVYFVLKTSYATSDTFPKDWRSYFDIYDFIANHLGSLEPTIRSSGDDVLPNVYCGIATVMLAPLYLFTKSISLKEKLANVAVMGIMFVSFNFNVISFVWHGFHYPSDLPYRFSFMYSFILLVMAYKTFERLNEFTSRQLLGTGMILMAFIILTQKIGSKNVGDDSVIMSIIFTAIFTLVFIVACDKRYSRSAVTLFLLCCVIAETVCCNTEHYDIDQAKVNYAGDYSSFKTIQSEICDGDEELFYRTELTYNRARMDPSWFGYNGISTFTSMAYEKLSKLEKSLGLASNNVDSYTYYLQTPVYNMMHAVKYIFDNDPDVYVDNDYYAELGTEGKFTAYKNKYYLPLIYCVNNSVADWDYSGSNPFDIQQDWFRQATGIEDDVFTRMEIDDITYYNVEDIASGLTSGNIYFDKTTSGQEGEITFFLSPVETGHCYIYVSSSDFDKINIRSDKITASQDVDEAYIYDLGVCEAGSTVTIVMGIDDDVDYGGFTFHPYSVNQTVLNKGYERLSKYKADINYFKETEIKATVTVPAKGLIYTSIPYDKGWSVELDGKKLSEDYILALGDGMLCIAAEPGLHRIRLSFMPQGLIPGIAVSAFALALLIAICLFMKIKSKKERAEEATEEAAEEAQLFYAESAQPEQITEQKFEEFILYEGSGESFAPTAEENKTAEMQGD